MSLSQRWICHFFGVVSRCRESCQVSLLETQIPRVGTSHYALLYSDPDYMLALALQQEDETALESTSPNQATVLGEEAVAMALFGQEERAPLEQRLGGGTAGLPLAPTGQGAPFTEDEDRFVWLLHACALRSAVQQYHRRIPAGLCCRI